MILWFWIIPWQVETADYGWLKPRTLPQALAIVLALCGAALFVFPTGDANPAASNWGRATLFAALLAFGLWLMGQIGFIYTAPLLAFCLMWLAHERRWFWLAIGSLGMPLFIWITVAQLLDRPLP